LRRDWLGYLPVYRWIDGKPVVVTIHTDQQDRVEGLRHGDHVLIGREDSDNAGIWIRKEKGPAFNSTLPARQVDADICDWLPTLWRLQGIITGGAIRGGATIPPVTTDCHLPVGDKPKLGVVTERAWKEAPLELRALAKQQEEYQEVKKRLKARGASTLNGDGEHTE
jgi:hypothetical protein